MLKKEWTFSQSIAAIIALFIIIFVSLFYLEAHPHIPLLISIVLIAFLSRIKGIKWNDLEEGILKGLHGSAKPVIIFALIGMLIAAWMMSGTIPTITVWALTIIRPEYLLVSSLLCCLLISTLIGSTFTTVSTVGVALIGTMQIAGIPLEYAAGAIICGVFLETRCHPCLIQRILHQPLLQSIFLII
ncbi:hypothetical protein LC087_00515 [Bacillus carboniphilus]|uniref:Na+/H+ antiporter NhaC-like C-terminal domain-containing protein n=1 Tax=Bacillus carboniphilus TaxID=86663 RepID=A0ABY9JYR8_9BACI|nr:hypothetical protein [Bacillus carboniphilus]WLR42766.1 hypothetical protein LC087_00515 [Bacillus carboniphilus]